MNINKNRWKKLAGIIKEGNDSDLTSEELNELESVVEKFLNKYIFTDEKWVGTGDELITGETREEKTIKAIIKILQDRISYY